MSSKVWPELPVNDHAGALVQSGQFTIMPPTTNWAPGTPASVVVVVEVAAQQEAALLVSVAVLVPSFELE